MPTPAALMDPPRDASLLPFWFWNDDLNEAELIRQIADFEAHGVYGFVIHPRVGLPRRLGWLSQPMLDLMRVAVEEARRRDMRVVLYDEGMYPSGSSSGQVVAANPAFACRGLKHFELQQHERPFIGEDRKLVAIVRRAGGQRMAVVDRPAKSVIRGLHYIDEGPDEDTPPAADLLNPQAVQRFIQLVYELYFEVLGEHFGKTIVAIFTDEPSLLGREGEAELRPGTTDILDHVQRLLGYDYRRYLPCLWYDDEPDAAHFRQEYHRAVAARLEETYYQPLSQWCQAHGIELTGHPAQPTDMAAQRYLHIPGQDLVWRHVVPHDPSALHGPASTGAKATSSAMIHLGRKRNAMELYGAYGHQFTWEEMKWLADWCFVRGTNLLYPHAFYYSVRGPRLDERPPDVGPNSPWWSRYRSFADYCRRMCWINCHSRHICEVAILAQPTMLHWGAAKVCFEHQRDFNYLEMRHLWEDAEVDENGIRLAGMNYQVLVIDNIRPIPEAAKAAVGALAAAGRVVVWSPGFSTTWLVNAEEAQDAKGLLAVIDRWVKRDVRLDPHHIDLRYRHMHKDGQHYYLLGNEGLETITTILETAATGPRFLFDAFTTVEEPLLATAAITLEPYTLKVVRIESAQ